MVTIYGRNSTQSGCEMPKVFVTNVLILFLPFFFFNLCCIFDNLNKCHLFPELCCFLTSRNEWFYASTEILSRESEGWHSVGRAQSSCPFCGRAEEAGKSGNEIMVQYVFTCPGGKGKIRSTTQSLLFLFLLDTCLKVVGICMLHSLLTLRWVFKWKNWIRVEMQLLPFLFVISSASGVVDSRSSPESLQFASWCSNRS